MSVLDRGQFRHFSESFPEELKPGNYWIGCNEKKAPRYLKDGTVRAASTTDPKTWRPYEEVLAGYETGRFHGIGRVLTEGLVGLDFDNCRNAETGRIDPRVLEVVNLFDSYTEISPSGEGIKIWIQTDLDYARSRVEPFKIEIYPGRAGGGRHFVVTGWWRRPISARVENRQRELDEFIEGEFPARARTIIRSGEYRGPELDLDQILEDGDVEILADVRDNTAERKYQILCPFTFIDEHTTEPETGTYVGQYDTGQTFFRCWHAHCSDRHWSAFFRKILPARPGVRRTGKVYASGEAVIDLG